MASPRTLDALALVCVRLVLSALVWSSGFRAVSDDDYARVVIAQKFASAPAWDPSGTSWLPFPFWVQGSAMLLFGPELQTATAVAWVSGVVSTLLIWLGARALGLGRASAFAAAALATGLAYSAWLGVATVPELLTTGLVVLAAATLAKPATRERNWGALALSCATLSRYETWPVACVFTLFCLLDCLRYKKLEPARARAFGSASLLASAGMLLWVGHGWINHGDPTFFIERVAHYQKALGGHDFHGWAAFSRYPLLTVMHAPALMGMATLGVVIVLLLRIEPGVPLASFTRPLFACAGLLVFLMISDLRGASATHHPARTLLPIWSLACIATAATCPAWIERALRFMRERFMRERFMRERFMRERFTSERFTSERFILRFGGIGIMTGLLMGLLIGAVLVIDGLHNHVFEGNQRFVDRSHELSLGERARRVATTGRLLIAPEDYGYFAMMAAFAAPARVDTFDDHDPRHARQGSLFETPEALLWLRLNGERLNGERLNGEGLKGEGLKGDRVQGLIVSQKYARQAQQFGTTVAMTPRYLLVSVGRRP